MKLSYLLDNIKNEISQDISEIEINNITTNPDKITDNTLFVFLKSATFNVKNILDYVITKKPSAIIADYDINTDMPIIKVKSTRAALPFLYSNFYGINYTKLRFIGITGTNGKTTTATMIKEILSASGEKVGFIGTGVIEIDNKKINEKYYSMTTPDPDLLYLSIKEMENNGCTVVVMEVSSHALHFDKVLPIPFEISLFLNLSDEHMDFHNSKEEYYKAKMKLFNQTKIGIFNMDDIFSKRAYSEVNCEKYTIGIINDANVMAKDIMMHGLCGSDYIYRESNKIFKVKLNLPGAYNLYNSMMALSCAIAFGVRPCIAKEAMNNIKMIDGRFEIISSTPCVIIDYAHTEEAMRNLLKTINSSKTFEQNIITVFGCGGDRYREKRASMAKIVEELSDFTVVTSDNSRTESEMGIIKDILTGFKRKDSRKVVLSRKEAIRYAIKIMKADDILVIVGKGHERYNIDKNGYHDFDERNIILNALYELKGGIKNKDENKNRVTADA